VHFTGIDSPYEPPASPEIRLDASGTVPAVESAGLVVEYLRQCGVLAPPQEPEAATDPS
jgi:bifunctional enzyme CysN/CysC